MENHAAIGSVLAKQQDQVLAEWLANLSKSTQSGGGRIKDAELEVQCRRFLDLMVRTLSGTIDADGKQKTLRDMLTEISQARAAQGFTPTDTANFIFSLKKPVFEALKRNFAKDADAIATANWAITVFLDTLGLYTMEVFLRTREDVVIRQQKEIAELSTPVVKLWDGILALPLIGTLDSERTGVVMENLLHSLIEHSADFAIIDITGVPTVDTLVAQHLLKTVAAARLMGADCLISGIRPQIAQTMVHLGVELNVTSKATLAEAFREALKRTGRTVTRIDQARVAPRPTV